MDYRLLASPWKNEFMDIIGSAEKELFISSPFVNLFGIKTLLKSIGRNDSLNLSLITSLTSANIVNGITEPSAFLELYNTFNEVNLSSLGHLHAKVYIVDDEYAIITSSNLTRGGLLNNLEYGVIIENNDVINSIKEDMLKYYSLGSMIDKALLKRVNLEAEKIRSFRQKSEETIKNYSISKLLEESLESLETELLKNRVKGQKTINMIFSETILYVLKREGSMSTEKLHHFVKAIHPDICDDSIDRVINGQHFGKKWKHQLRTAQQHLKAKGLIYLENGEWHLRSSE